MRSISNAFGLDTYEMAEIVTADDDGNPVTEVDDLLSMPRVKKSELEMAYRKDPVIRNSIRFIQRFLMHAGHELTDASPETIDFFRSFLQRIGASGSETTWEDLLKKIFQHQMIYGDAWVELIFSKSGSRIVDMDIIDPKTMDFARDQDGNVLVDRFHRPMGYVQVLPNKHMAERLQKDPLPDGIHLPGNSIFLLPKRIVHFKLDTVGSGFHGIGLIEPIYDITKFKLNLEQQLIEATLKIGTGIITAEVGDQNHEPNPQQIQNILKKIKEAHYKTELGVPHYVKLNSLEVKYAERFLNFLNYYIDQQITGVGIPGAFATGAGEDTNRATLDRQEALMKMGMKDFVNQTVSVIQSKIFSRIAELEGLGEFPLVKWGELSVDELNSKVDRITKLANQKVGVLRPTKELENFIKKLEGLP